MKKGSFTDSLTLTIIAFNIVLFIIDIFTPLGYSEWILYLIPLLLTYKKEEPSSPYFAAAFSTLLIYLGIIVSPPGLHNTTIALINRSICVIVIWMFAFLIWQGKRLANALSMTSERLQMHIENTPLAVVEFNKDYRITYWSKQAEKMFGWTANEVMGKCIIELRWVHEDDAPLVANLSADMLATRRASNIHINRNYRKDGAILICEWFNSALYDSSGKLVSVHSLVQDITETKQIEKEREKLIADLQLALSDVKTLKGLIPICASCKKIRDDKGYWNQLESYIRDHSEAQFSHGICPDCARQLYPEFFKD